MEGGREGGGGVEREREILELFVPLCLDELQPFYSACVSIRLSHK